MWRISATALHPACSVCEASREDAPGTSRARRNMILDCGGIMEDIPRCENAKSHEGAGERRHVDGYRFFAI